MPMVVMNDCVKEASQNLSNKHDLPTPLSCSYTKVSLDVNIFKNILKYIGITYLQSSIVLAIRHIPVAFLRNNIKEFRFDVVEI